MYWKTAIYSGPYFDGYIKVVAMQIKKRERKRSPSENARMGTSVNVAKSFSLTDPQTISNQ
jgi:hypothetical protein